MKNNLKITIFHKWFSDASTTNVYSTHKILTGTNMSFDTNIEQEGWSRVWRLDGAGEDVDGEDDPNDE